MTPFLLLVGLLIIGLLNRMSFGQALLYIALGALGGWLIAGCGPTPDTREETAPVNTSVQKLMI